MPVFGTLAAQQSVRLSVAALSLGIVFFATAVAGTLSTFTSTVSKPQSVALGTFAFALNDPSGGGLFSTDITGMAPGDLADRLVNVTNAGSIAYASIAVAVTAPTSSLADTDANNGLKLQVDDCSTPWTQASTAVAATCSGTLTAETAVTAVSSLKSTGLVYNTGLVSLASGTDYLRFRYNLPSVSVGASGILSALSFAVTATQAPGGAFH